MYENLEFKTIEELFTFPALKSDICCEEPLLSNTPLKVNTVNLNGQKAEAEIKLLTPIVVKSTQFSLRFEKKKKVKFA
ncbi:hypothetical protein HK099_008444, partial [Clydaea vesicula]